MAHKCFISFKTQDIEYKKYIHEQLDVDMIDKSLHEPIKSEDEDYIMRKIREDYLSDSTVTIFLIGEYCAENNNLENQRFIKRELQASLYHRQGNTRNGILGVILPPMINRVLQGSYYCSQCNDSHNSVNIGDETVISEFSYNYYIPQNGKCSWLEEDRYCVLTTWEEFIKNPNIYIEYAFQKRNLPIANKTRVRPYMEQKDFPCYFIAGDNASLKAQKYYLRLFRLDLILMCIASIATIYSFNEIELRKYIYYVVFSL